MSKDKKTPYASDLNFDKLCHKLRMNENFSFSRIASDGELNAIKGAKGANCDSHPYDPVMGKQLKEIFEKPQRYYLGLQRMAYQMTIGNTEEMKFQEYIDQTQEKYGHVWTEADILHHASIKGQLERDFIPALNGRNIVLVAPRRLSVLMTKYPKAFGKMTHIVIPDVYCYQAFDSVLKTLRKEVEQDDVIVYCASMMTKILIDRMYDSFGDGITQIDAGSVLEPYCGFNNRSYHKNIKSRM